MYSMLVQGGTVWLYAVPMAFIGAVVFRPVYVVYFFICLEEVVKLFFEFARLRSGKWVNNVISSN